MTASFTPTPAPGTTPSHNCSRRRPAAHPARRTRPPAAGPHAGPDPRQRASPLDSLGSLPLESSGQTGHHRPPSARPLRRRTQPAVTSLAHAAKSRAVMPLACSVAPALPPTHPQCSTPSAPQGVFASLRSALCAAFRRSPKTTHGSKRQGGKRDRGCPAKTFCCQANSFYSRPVVHATPFFVFVLVLLAAPRRRHAQY